MDLNTETSIDVGGGAPPDSGSFDRGAVDRNDRGLDRSDRAERRSVRDDLRAQFEEARTRDEEERDRFSDRRPPGETQREGTTEQVPPIQGQQPDQQGQAQTQQQTQVQAPPAWAKEARDVWAQVPPAAQQAILKREQDVQQGFEHFRQQYANYYGEIDQAIAPFAQEIQKYGKTPGQAVAQLFSWFDMLAKDPDRAFPALLRSYNFDPRRLAAAYGYTVNGQRNFQADPRLQQQQQTLQQQAANRQRFEQYIANQVQQRLAPVYNHMQEQQTAKTNEMLELWAKDKPHFEAVRVTMGQLLSPDPQTGQAMIPLKDGKVDLDGAYEAACNLHPEVRQQLWEGYINAKEQERKALEQKQAKERQAQAEKARRASGSLSTAAPGAPAARNQQAKPKGKSVRESLMDSINEMSGR